MTRFSSSPDIITEALFDKYTALWLEAVDVPDSPVLAQAFSTPPSGDRLLFVSFPIERISGLLSAVGIYQINARFMLVPDDSSGSQRFSVALFAANIQEERVSAYYVPDPYWSNAPQPELLGEPIPNSLAGAWLDNWKAAPQPQATMFATSYGSLKGYNFEVKDFLTPLFGWQPGTGQAIRLYLGLHQYYAVGSDGESQAQTLGLVARLYDPKQPDRTASADQFFDMSGPCPPNH